MMSSHDFHEKQILFLVAKDGEKLSFRNDNVIVTDKNGNIKHQSTCYRLFAIIVVGHISITTGLLQRAKKIRLWVGLYDRRFQNVSICIFYGPGKRHAA